MAKWGEIKCPRCEELEAENANLKQMWWDASDVTDLAGTIADLEAKLRKSALQELSALGQASEVYQAQLAAEAKLAAIDDLMVRRIKHHQEMKDLGGSGMARKREHYKLHVLSETLGEIRKVTKARTTLAELKGQGE